MLTSLKPYVNDNQIYGEYFENESVFVFFGNKYFEKQHLNFFSDVSFQFLKQVHGNEVVPVVRISEETPVADGHYTAQKKVALLIQTADCLPVMIYDSTSSWVMALHAGWRGIENKIIQNGLTKLPTNQSKISFFIGPHIQYESFEVDRDVADKLSACVTSPIDSKYNDQNKKYYFNLKKIALSQVEALSIKTGEIYLSNINTFNHLDYSSFRRQKAPCRNYSFIYLK